jgi:hypothetical protein
MSPAMFLATIRNYEQGNIASLIKIYSKSCHSNKLEGIFNCYLFLPVYYASTRLVTCDLILCNC